MFFKERPRYYDSMNVTLSWDLVIIVFFAIVMAYSFIIGKQQSIKVIIASYIAIIATQGIANVLVRLSGESLGALHIADVTYNVTVLSIIKIALFAVCMILFVTKSGIHVEYTKDPGSLMNIAYTAIFGFSTAGLMVSTILTYVSGNAILDAGISVSGVIAPIAEQSPLLQIMVFNQDLWFAFPALLIAGAGFASNE